MTETNAVEVKNLSVAYQDIPALWDVSFTINMGNLIAIVGPNGAGKSTLLKAILGLVDHDTGSINLMGHQYDEIDHRHEHIAYVPQRGSIDWDFPINCLDVVMMGRYGHLGWLKRPGKREQKLAMESLEKFGMQDYAKRQIGELSGGQKQRIFLARAYVQDADIIFLDEPFGGVDAKTEQVTLDLLKELRDLGKTILVVTHDLQSLKHYFDMVLLLNTSMVACGKPEKVLTAENLKQAYGGVLHMTHGAHHH